jgi:hypothetical protein
MKPYNGFILKFMAQICPPGQDPLVRDMWEKMRLLASIWKEVPEKLVNLFLRQHKRLISKESTIHPNPPI